MKNKMIYHTLTTRKTRMKLGGHLTSFKKNPNVIYVVERRGCDDYAGVLVSPKFLRDNGIDIQQKPISEKDYESAKMTYDDAKALVDNAKVLIDEYESAAKKK